jgi:hypothetical protein
MKKKYSAYECQCLLGRGQLSSKTTSAVGDVALAFAENVVKEVAAADETNAVGAVGVVNADVEVVEAAVVGHGGAPKIQGLVLVEGDND